MGSDSIDLEVGSIESDPIDCNSATPATATLFGATGNAKSVLATGSVGVGIDMAQIVILSPKNISLVSRLMGYVEQGQGHTRPHAVEFPIRICLDVFSYPLRRCLS